MNRSVLRVMASLYMAAIPGAYAADVPPAPAAFNPAEIRAAMEAFNKMPDTVGTGKYPALKEEVASLPDHVIYRPADLAKLGRDKLGVLVWGNGGCSADGAGGRLHLAEIASHGYLAIASGRILSGPGAPANAKSAMPAAGGGIPPPATKAASLTEAIDWALKENARVGSPYFGRINPSWIAVSGWSCGGLQALKVAADSRVHAVVIHSSGIFDAGANPIPGMELDKSALAKLHTPVIYILGGPTDIAYANGEDDFKRIEHIPVMVANLDVGHGGTFMQPNGGLEASVAVSWLDWQFKGDARAAKRFTGPDCGLCTDPQWRIQRKNFGAGAVQ
jgi:hypothetical protein